jgi:hypothetical protein
MKDMNMNAVRMSHYPPDAEFLDLCDSLGLFVLDELTGWQKKYATPVGAKLVAELVKRDVNHPSIIFWDNGNEGGWNTDLDGFYAQYDPQYRTVLHPWSNFNNVDTKHYPDYTYIEKAAEKDDILLHTEMIHGLYDGGHGAGLEDYWNLMRSNPRHAGGFYGCWLMKALCEKTNTTALILTATMHPMELLGHIAKKKEVIIRSKNCGRRCRLQNLCWIKILWETGNREQLSLHKSFIVQIQWELIKYPSARNRVKKTAYVFATGKTSIQLEPGKKGSHYAAILTKNWNDADAVEFFCSMIVYGRELYTWTWPIKMPADVNAPKKFQMYKTTISRPERKEEGTIYTIRTRWCKI